MLQMPTSTEFQAKAQTTLRKRSRKQLFVWVLFTMTLAIACELTTLPAIGHSPSRALALLGFSPLAIFPVKLTRAVERPGADDNLDPWESCLESLKMILLRMDSCTPGHGLLLCPRPQLAGSLSATPLSSEIRQPVPDIGDPSPSGQLLAHSSETRGRASARR